MYFACSLRKEQGYLISFYRKLPPNTFVDTGIDIHLVINDNTGCTFVSETGIEACKKKNI